MSMSTFVEGFIPPDGKFKKMIEAYRACERAGVPVPAEVEKFFGGEPPDETGRKIDLTFDKKFKNAVYEVQDEACQGMEIDLEKLRAINPDIKIVRVKNCW